MTYLTLISPDLLTPSEIAANSHMAAVQRHYAHMNAELKDGVIRDCYLCQEIQPQCSTCKVSERGTWPTLRKAGWVFDIDGHDFCGKHDPYSTIRIHGSKPHRRNKYGTNEIFKRRRTTLRCDRGQHQD